MRKVRQSLAAAIPGDEIPAATVVDERVRLDLATAVGAGRGCGSRSEGARESRQAAAITVRCCGSTVGPETGSVERRRAQRADAAAQVRRQDLLELDEGAHGGFLDARDGCAGGGAKADRDRDRLVVIEQQRRHRASGAKPVTAGRAGQRFDGVAELAQPLDVAPDRPAGHLEALGQLVSRPIAASLEQGEQFQKPARGLAHRISSSGRIEDRF